MHHYRCWAAWLSLPLIGGSAILYCVMAPPPIVQPSGWARGDVSGIPRATRDYDLGTILVGTASSLGATIEIENGHEVPIRILGARALSPCCSSMGKPPEFVPGRSSARLPIWLKIAGKSGAIVAHFAVRTDEREDASRVYSVRADLIDEFECEVAGGSYLRPVAGQDHHGLLLIRRRWKRDAPTARLTEIRPSDRLEILAFRRLGGDQDLGGYVESVHEVEFKVRSEVCGLHRIAFGFVWDDGRTFNETITAEITPEILASPAAIVLAEYQDEAIVVVHSTTRPFAIRGVSGPVEWPDDATDSVSSPGKMHRLSLKIDRMRLAEGRGLITIHTDHPAQKSIGVAILNPRGGAER